MGEEGDRMVGSTVSWTDIPISENSDGSRPIRWLPPWAGGPGDALGPPELGLGVMNKEVMRIQFHSLLQEYCP